MTDSDTRTETWKPIPRFGRYEASDLGRIRNSKGLVMKARLSNRGYPQLDLTDDEGRVRTVTVHTMVLLAFAGPCPDGMEAKHANDVSEDNRWPENLSWGTHSENEKDKFANGRPHPVPPRQPKRCVRCKGEFEGNGRRCHGCVVSIGQDAAYLLRSGVRLEVAAQELHYPSVEGLHALAVKYGGYGREPQRRGLFVTLRDSLRRVTRSDRLRGGDAA